MTPDALFQIANPVAMLGWLTLAFSPVAPKAVLSVATVVVPLLLSTAYTAIVLAYWQSGEGGFDSLSNVAALFQNRWLLLAGWVHYLAFDLLMGAWQAGLGALPCSTVCVAGLSVVCQGSDLPDHTLPPRRRAAHRSVPAYRA